MDLYSRCIKCGREFDGIVSRCPNCGYITQVEYPRLKWIVKKSVPSIWRYSYMLPPVDAKVSFDEGYTPLRRVGGVVAKMENLNPTRSYADRASSVIVSFTKPKRVRMGYVRDFASSMAYYLASVGAGVEVVADPEDIELDDLLFLDRLGAKIQFSEGSIDGEAVYESPISIEGLKTIAYEIAEASPKEDEIFVPAESGLLAYSIGKGLTELVDLGVAPEYGLVAVTIKGAPTPKILKHSKYKIKVIEVASGDVLEAVLKLSKTGLKVRPLAATSYAAASSQGSGIAIITGSSRMMPPTPRNRLSELKSMIVRFLQERGEATAYEIWRNLGKDYSLKGVYKALKSLEAQGYTTSTYVMKGDRKVKVYTVCK